MYLEAFLRASRAEHVATLKNKSIPAVDADLVCIAYRTNAIIYLDLTL